MKLIEYDKFNNMTKKEAQEDFIDLINSTIEGETGEWDCCTEEGKEGFKAMRNALYALADYCNIDIPMKKNNRFILVLILTVFALFSTKAFSQSKLIDMNDSCGMTFNQLLDNVAVVYGVHSQLKHEKIHIPAFDKLIEDIRNSLKNSGVSFKELAQNDKFLISSGHARICAHNYYPELSKTYGVKLPKYMPLNLGFCKQSIAKAIQNIKGYIY